MAIEAFERMQYAIAATRFGGGQKTVAVKVRSGGVRVFEQILCSLQADSRRAIETQAADLLDGGVDAILLGQSNYPEQLSLSRQSPAALFLKGPPRLFEQPGIGMCGSRRASSEGLRAAHSCADAVARRGYSVISGYAKGVDSVAHSAALASGGANPGAAQAPRRSWCLPKV